MSNKNRRGIKEESKRNEREMKASRGRISKKVSCFDSFGKSCVNVFCRKRFCSNYWVSQFQEKGGETRDLSLLSASTEEAVCASSSTERELKELRAN